MFLETINSYLSSPEYFLGFLTCIPLFFWHCRCCDDERTIDGIIVRCFDPSGIELWNKRQSDFGFIPDDRLAAITYNHFYFAPVANSTYASSLTFDKIWSDWSGGVYFLTDKFRNNDIPTTINRPFDKPWRLIKLDSTTGELIFDLTIRGIIDCKSPIAIDFDSNLYILQHDNFFGNFQENFKILKLDSDGNIINSSLVRQFVGAKDQTGISSTISAWQIYPWSSGSRISVYIDRYNGEGGSTVIPFASFLDMGFVYDTETGNEIIGAGVSSGIYLRSSRPRISTSIGGPTNPIDLVFCSGQWYDVDGSTLGLGVHQLISSSQAPYKSWPHNILGGFPDAGLNDETLFPPFVFPGGLNHTSVKRAINGNHKQGLNYCPSAFGIIVQSTTESLDPTYFYNICPDLNISDNRHTDLRPVSFSTSACETNPDDWVSMGGFSPKFTYKAIEARDWEGNILWEQDHFHRIPFRFLSPHGTYVQEGALTVGIYDSNGNIISVGFPDYRPINISDGITGNLGPLDTDSLGPLTP